MVAGGRILRHPLDTWKCVGRDIKSDGKSPCEPGVFASHSPVDPRWNYETICDVPALVS